MGFCGNWKQRKHEKWRLRQSGNWASWKCDNLISGPESPARRPSVSQYHVDTEQPTLTVGKTRDNRIIGIVDCGLNGHRDI